MYKLIPAALAIMIIPLITPRAVSAHVLLRDDSHKYGAILHINPDDNPIAGETANLLLDIQTIKLDNQTKATLYVDNGSSKSTVIGKIDKSLVTFDYNFPSQGVYDLQFIVKSGNTELNFQEAWRVSRGISATEQIEQKYPWTSGVIIFSLTATAFLTTIVLARWKQIWDQSHF